MRCAAWSATGPESVEDVFCQNFTAGVPGIGETLTVPLKDDGEDIMVTEDNRREFVDLYVDYYLNNAIHKQVRVCAPIEHFPCCVRTLLHVELLLYTSCSLVQLVLLWGKGTVAVQLHSMTLVLS